MDERLSFANDKRPWGWRSLAHAGLGHAWHAQLGRFLLSGGLATALTAGVYIIGAIFLGIRPLFANAIGYACGIGVGYLLHSRFSFRRYGSRDASSKRLARFFCVCLLSFGLNSAWVWLLTEVLGYGPAVALAPMLCVTPMITFYCNRRWTFV